MNLWYWVGVVVFTAAVLFAAGYLEGKMEREWTMQVIRAAAEIQHERR